MARYDISQIKSLAIGLWPKLLGLDNEILDRLHHPCPKCGGRDRFRALDDFRTSGAVICNKCFNVGNGDGIAAYAWLHDCTNGQAIEAIAKELGVEPSKKQPGGERSQVGSKKRVGTKSVKNRHDSEHDEPRKRKSLDQLFAFKPWNESLAAIFCTRKRGISVPSLVAVGARFAIHSGVTVIALPICDGNQVVGYTAANCTGGKIAIQSQDKTQPPELTTWKNKIPSKAKGVIATENLFTGTDQIKRVFKTEGPSDLLAIIPLLAADEAAFCNPCGANENPEPFTWLAELLAGKQIIVIHDRDAAGVSGAIGDEKRSRLGWASWAASFASEARNVELPYPLVDSHGKDLRDWVCDGGDRAGLDKLIEEADVIQHTPAVILEDGADPHYLARVNLQNYQENHGRRLVFWKNEWYRWKAGCYVRVETSELRSKVSAAIRIEFEIQWKADFASYNAWKASDDWNEKKDKGPPKIKKVTPQLVTAVICAMASIVQLPGTINMPCWLEDRSERHYVSMQNGILDFDKVFAGSDVSDFLLPHSSNWFSQFQLGYKFDFGSKCPTWFEYLNYSLDGDVERIAILQEWAGYLLTTTNYLQKFIVLEGKGGNGKTVYFAAIRAMLGNENVSSVALENFGGRFDLSTTIGKAANICGDVGEIDSVSEGALKQFTGGDAMTFDRKGTTPIEMIPTAKLMCAWNLRPRFKDRSSGVWRRMILVPFDREIEESRKISGMDSYKFWLQSGEVSAILRWAIEGLDRLKTMGRFTKSKVCEKAAAEYRLESNPANDFLVETIKEEAEGRISCQWLYELYTMWCKQAGHNYPLARNQFGKEVKRAFPNAERKIMKPNNFIEAGSEDRDRTWFYTGIEFSVDKICGRYVYGEDIE
jgi:P4 family phage/plasmid primase-like protien